VLDRNLTASKETVVSKSRGLRQRVGRLRDRRTPPEPPPPTPEELAQARLAAYFAEHDSYNLQIGSGRTTLPGWLSTDLRPKSDEVVPMDATQPFPFDDDVFEHVYLEHMIEHIGYLDGQVMLKECLRVLRPGGVLRVATPDLQVLIDLYEHRGGEDGDHYVRWVTRRYLEGISHRHPVFVLNNAMRNWGHTFLYDGEVLTLALEDAGFTDVTRSAFGESRFEALRGVESHGDAVSNERSVRFETMIFEARKPG
jgi:predicted SAM-dependent methyltransferase